MLIPSDGSVVRYVHVTCLKLKRDEGYTLVALGKWDDIEGILLPDIKLPGSKLKDFEGPEAALQRVLAEDLGPLKEATIVGNREDTRQKQKSSKYEIDTEYIKYIYEAKLGPSYVFATGQSEVLNDLLLYFDDDTEKEVQVYAWMSPQLYDKVFVSQTNDTDFDMTLQSFSIDQAIGLSKMFAQVEP